MNKKDTLHYISLALIVCIIAGGIAAAIAMRHRTDAELRDNLKERSQTIASTLDAQDVLALSGTSKDEKRPAYTLLKERLANVKRVNSDTRSIYLAGQRSGQVFFYVDSEKPSSSQYSPAGERYDDATPEFTQMFTNGKTVVEGPVTDDFGTVISGLAPVLADNKVVAVVGIDISSDFYHRTLLMATIQPLLIGISLVLVVGFLEWSRRRNRQLLIARSELLSVASHELRTPIVGIRWAAEAMQRQQLDTFNAKMIHAIHESALNLQASTDDILELTKIQKSYKTVLQPADVIQLMRDVVETQQLAAEAKNVQIIYGASWPESAEIQADVAKLKRALHNIVSNAIKYTKVNTNVTLEYAHENKNHRITVRDEGIGIPEKEQSRVFGGFYRASNAKSSDIPGTGLGLYLVKMVIHEHKGTISLTSKENIGTTVTISLPDTGTATHVPESDR
jgi:signal transduction histidine kinase